MFYIGFFVKKWAIRSFPHFLWSLWMNHSGRSLKMRDVSKLLRSLTKNEREWATRSGCSPKTSDHERIVQVSHQKWANERIDRFWANSSFFERIARFLSKSLILSFFRKHELSLRNPVSEFPALAEAEAGAIFFFGSSSVSGSSQKGRLRLYNIIKIMTKIIPFWRITKWNTSLIKHQTWSHSILKSQKCII